MNRQVSFATSRFENKTPGEHFINERCFGEDLAAWIREVISGDGFAFGEPYQEDWGWATDCARDGQKYFVAVGIVDETIGADVAEWIVTIELAKKWLSFRRPDESGLDELTSRLDSALRAAADIADVRWEE